ncbi:putative serine protease K12H4.7 isoform X2 [Contarinia nasturtii]|uniref:putative serine protease K12H4.7 isoform X2 n=1 Tax=Contarinia nasturtii TaxID=265458 RepID=UPI0012D406DE|nr:putative serine protease K12H4.7 isoform X2 [Contarinia nasturtii]
MLVKSMLSQIVLVLNFIHLQTQFMVAEAFSTILKRQMLIFHEPPFENNFIRSDQVIEHYITQRLDHFNHQNNFTFEMRYLTNNIWFKKGGPIFIMIGGEWKISAGHILPGQLIYDMAKENNGLLLYSEHRFYGKTQPTDSTSTENLKYLTVEQSLADLANLIRVITSDKAMNATGGVILVGGSYSATMAVWFKQKYPHLVKGVWASSAPLNAKLNYFEYTETVGKSIRKVGGEDCYIVIEDIFESLEGLLESDDSESLTNLFKICNNFDTKNILDVWNFISSVKNIFSGLVQGYRPGLIEHYCKYLSTENANATNDIESHELFPFAQLFQRTFLTANEKCVSINYEDDIKELKKDNTSLAYAFRPWFYQTCSQFGWYQTTDSQKHPFGTKSPIEFYLKLCQDLFSDVFNDFTFEENINHTNLLYGALDPAVRNVYFSHGSLDPWHPMGVLNDLNEHSPSMVIPGLIFHSVFLIVEIWDP